MAHSFRLEVMVASNDSWSVFSQHWSARAAGLANSNNKLFKERTVRQILFVGKDKSEWKITWVTMTT